MNLGRPVKQELAPPVVRIELDGEVTKVGKMRIKWNAMKTFGVIQEDHTMNLSYREDVSS